MVARVRFRASHDSVVRSPRRWPLTVPGSAFMCAAAIGVCVTVALLFRNKCAVDQLCLERIWSDYTWGPYLDGKTYCENSTASAMWNEPVNAWSNAVFLGMGVLLLSFAWADARLLRRRVHSKSEPSCLTGTRRVYLCGARDCTLDPCVSNQIVRSPLFTLSLAVAMMYLSMGSFLLHSNRTKITLAMDKVGIQIVVLMLVACALAAFASIRWYKWVLYGVTLVSVGVVCAIRFHLRSWMLQIEVAVLCVLLLANVWRTRMPPQTPTYMAGLANGCVFFLIAVVCKYLDVDEDLCDPESKLQFHAAWHVFCALAAFELYLHMRSTNTISEDQQHDSGEKPV